MIDPLGVESALSDDPLAVGCEDRAANSCRGTCRMIKSDPAFGNASELARPSMSFSFRWRQACAAPVFNKLGEIHLDRDLVAGHFIYA